jgi:uncharacterized protein YkwD
MILISLTCSKEHVNDIYIPNENIVLSESDDTLFLIINNYRVDHGLSVLKIDSLTTELAAGHVLYMIDKGVLSHDYFSIRANLSHAERVGEIVAYNYQTPLSMLTAYLGSPPHKAILDNPNFTHIGISTIEDYNCCILTSY